MAPPPYAEFTFETVRKRSLDYMALNPNQGVCGHMPKHDLLARTTGVFPVLDEMILRSLKLQKVISTPEGIDNLLKSAPIKYGWKRTRRG